VSAGDLATQIAGYAASIETTSAEVDSTVYYGLVADVYISFPGGSFDSSFSSILHAKLCASSSLALQDLFVNYGLDGSNDSSLLGMVGNAYINNSAAVPLHHLVQLTYISTADIALITGAITGFACLVCAVGMAFAAHSLINVKPATDSSLLYNADPSLIARKQALMSGLSNDPHGQLALEFKADSILYCREVTLDYSYPDSADPTKHKTYSRVNISYSSKGAAPNAFDHYL
jgi:hypothetical protein